MENAWDVYRRIARYALEEFVQHVDSDFPYLRMEAAVSSAQIIIFPKMESARNVQMTALDASMVSTAICAIHHERYLWMEVVGFVSLTMDITRQRNSACHATESAKHVQGVKELTALIAFLDFCLVSTVSVGIVHQTSQLKCRQ